MVEKWMQGKSNPYLRHKSRAHYGKPAMLFKDSDKDGVMNVFDCKPFNKRKQDVISPLAGSNMDRILTAQENARQQKVYSDWLKEQQRLEAERLTAENYRLAHLSSRKTQVRPNSTGFVPTLSMPSGPPQGQQGRNTIWSQGGNIYSYDAKTKTVTDWGKDKETRNKRGRGQW